jgi:hypothetical protein
MPLDQLSAFGFVVVVVAAFGAASVFQHRYFARLRADLKDDPDVEVVDAPGFGSFGVRTRPARRPARLSLQGSGNGERGQHWHFSSEAPHVWQRTTLKLMSTAALSGRIVGLEGLNADTGDAALSARLLLGGARPDVVRGLFRVPAVRDAAIALVDEHAVRRFTIDGRGEVSCTVRHDMAQRVDVKKLLLALVAFVDTLEAAAKDAPALPETAQARALLDATGSASGAPVGVPGGLIDRR